jgi:hypothetical protein
MRHVVYMAVWFLYNESNKRPCDIIVSNNGCVLSMCGDNSSVFNVLIIKLLCFCNITSILI